MRLATISNIRKAIKESGIEESDYLRRIDEKEDKVKQETIDTQQYGSSLVISETDQSPICQNLENTGHVRHCQANWVPEREEAEDSGQQIREPRSIFDAKAIKTEPVEDNSDLPFTGNGLSNLLHFEVPASTGLSRNSLQLDETNRPGESENAEDDSSHVYRIEDFTQMAQIFARVFRAGKTKNVFTRDYRQAFLTRLHITADFPDTLTNFDVSSAIPTFVHKNFRSSLRDKIIKVIREYQRAERAKKVYFAALQQLGFQQC